MVTRHIDGWSTTSRCGDETCEREDCVRDCSCGRGRYPSCRFSSCYECFLDRRADFLACILCGRWHGPQFDTCFKCRPETRGRDDAAQALRQLILHRDGYTCQNCGAQVGDEQYDPRAYATGGTRHATLQVDHIVPCAKGGTADEWNLQTLCGLCNYAKGAVWYVGCRYEDVKTKIVKRYLGVAATYFAQDERARFIEAVRRYRHTGTWDPATQDEYARHNNPEVTS